MEQIRTFLIKYFDRQLPEVEKAKISLDLKKKEIECAKLELSLSYIFKNDYKDELPNVKKTNFQSFLF